MALHGGKSPLMVQAEVLAVQEIQLQALYRFV
jgi:hypothetical protein